MSVPTVGILGGVGSGKSSVVRQVSDLRLKIIDADRIGHDVLEHPDVLSQLREKFPASVFDREGKVIRSELAQRVFGSTADNERALQQLEQVVHPAILQEIRCQQQAAGDDIDAVILDAAILLEKGWGEVCDALVFVDTPAALRAQRVQENRGWSEEELQRREAAQWSVDEKKQQANFIVDNSGTLQQAAQQMSEILRQLVAD